MKIVLRRSWLYLAIVVLAACQVKSTREQPGQQIASTGTTSSQSETNLVDTPLSTGIEVQEDIASIPTLAAINPTNLQGITLQFWHAWFGDQRKLLQSIVDEFNLRNEYGIRVNVVYRGNYNDLYRKIEAGIQTGELPDISPGHLYQILYWQSLKKIVVDLTPYIHDATWGFNAKDPSDFYPSFWEQEVVNGEHLGIPAQRFAQFMVYNQTWARQLGFGSPPKTPEEFKAQVCAAAQMNRFDEDLQNDGTGGWLVNTSPSAILSWLYAFGSQVIHPSGSGYLFNTSTSQEALAFLKDLKDNGCAWQSSNQGETEFSARRALIITASIADFPYIEKALKEAGNTDEWTVLAFPSLTQPVVVTYGPSLVIFESNSERQLAAWLFIKWLLMPQNQARWIEVSSALPTRYSITEALSHYAFTHPSWAAAVELLPYAKNEPLFPSWSIVRWAVSDVGTQVFRSYFTPERIPATLELLDETAAELDTQIRNINSP